MALIKLNINDKLVHDNTYMYMINFASKSHPNIHVDSSIVYLDDTLTQNLYLCQHNLNHCYQKPLTYIHAYRWKRYLSKLWHGWSNANICSNTRSGPIWKYHRRNGDWWCKRCAFSSVLGEPSETKSVKVWILFQRGGPIESQVFKINQK